MNEDEQTQARVDAEQAILTLRRSKDQDVETKAAAILDEETSLLAEIDKEEKEKRSELLSGGGKVSGVTVDRYSN